MNLTKAERKRLAKAARALAMECAAGTAPELDPTSFCDCAASEIVKRAMPTLDRETVRWEAFELDKAHGFLLTAATWLIHGIEYGSGKHVVPGSGAAVFPLLWLADELESGR